MRSFLLPMHLRRDFQAQGVEPDEAGGVGLIAGFGFGFHRGIQQTPIALFWQRQSRGHHQCRRTGRKLRYQKTLIPRLKHHHVVVGQFVELRGDIRALLLDFERGAVRGPPRAANMHAVVAANADANVVERDQFGKQALAAGQVDAVNHEPAKDLLRKRLLAVLGREALPRANVEDKVESVRKLRPAKSNKG
jgi:hypothetical protein